MFDSDEDTIFNEKNMNNTIKKLYKNTEQELSSSTRDMITTMLIGQTLAQIRLTRVETSETLKTINSRIRDTTWRHNKTLRNRGIYKRHPRPGGER